MYNPAMPRRSMILSGLSLLLCVAAAVLWVRSYRVHSRVGVSTSRARYTLHSDHGRVTLTGPPSRGPEDALAWQMARRINNDEVLWELNPIWRGIGGKPYYYLQPHIRRHSDTWAMDRHFDSRGGMQSSGMKSAARALLMALEDPNRVIAAADELQFLRQGGLSKTSETHGDSVTVYFDGLPVVCRISDFPVRLHVRNPDDFWITERPVGQADPSAWRGLRATCGTTGWMCE